MKSASKQKLMQRNAARAEAMLKQLANANRLMILCQLAEGEQSVGALVKQLGLSHSAVSQHLAKMRALGLVSHEKRGLHVYYQLSSVEVSALLSTLYLIYCRP